MSHATCELVTHHQVGRRPCVSRHLPSCPWRAITFRHEPLFVAGYNKRLRDHKETNYCIIAFIAVAGHVIPRGRIYQTTNRASTLEEESIAPCTESEPTNPLEEQRRLQRCTDQSIGPCWLCCSYYRWAFRMPIARHGPHHCDRSDGIPTRRHHPI